MPTGIPRRFWLAGMMRLLFPADYTLTASHARRDRDDADSWSTLLRLIFKFFPGAIDSRHFRAPQIEATISE